MPIDTPDWVRDAVFYQIFPDRFAMSERVVKPGPLEPWDHPPTHHGFKGGDLLGIAERLPYLQELGVNALYLTPVFSSASNHRYHTFDYFQVDPLLGGNDALRELLDEAHARGMRVVLDGVFNHTGRGFWPFHHVLETGAASPYRHWFHFDPEALDEGIPVMAYPAATARHGVAIDQPSVGETAPAGDGSWSLRRLGYRAWWDLPALPKLNTDEPAVREYLLSVAEHWIRFGIDGWRLDVPAEIQDETFWQEFRRRVRAINPEAYLVGEIWQVAPEWLRGDRFDALMNYPLAEAILSFAGTGHHDRALLDRHHEYGPNVREMDGAGFARRLDELLHVYPPEITAVQLNLLDSHDSPRYHTFVGGDRASYRLAVLLQATLPGAPCVYYGDEIGLEGFHDPDCRRAFPWDESRWDGELLAWVRSVLALRHAEPALRRGELRIAGASGGAVAFERRLGERLLIVALNAGTEPVALEVSGPSLDAGRLRWLRTPDGAMDSAGGLGRSSDGRVSLALPPRAGGVLECI
jgi:cyclomaltodextrinase / maltogenic alpha-amylase / neopullulanase